MFGRRARGRHYAEDGPVAGGPVGDGAAVGDTGYDEYGDDFAAENGAGHDDAHPDRPDLGGARLGGADPDGAYPDDGDDDADDAEYADYSGVELTEPVAGPYDEDEAPEDGVARLDLGSVQLPMPDGAQVQVEMDPAGPLKAVHLITPNTRLTVSAYAAPRTDRLWPEIHRELAEQLTADGARVRKEIGEWGTEIVAFVDNVLLRFIGVDGPRWMLRAVAAGPKEQSAAAAAELRDVIRESVVVRGKQPMPVRTPLPIQLPPEIVAHIEQLQSAGQ
jgi:hypothetical protein